MFCQKCGKENEDSASLCTTCGATLSKQEAPGAKKASGSKFWKRLGIGCAIIVGVVGIAIVGLVPARCISEFRLNENPPEYMEQVAADYYYAIGHTPSNGPDGLIVFFRLADSSRQMTTSDGTATITIVEWASRTELYSQVVEVKRSDFRKRTYGGDILHQEVYIQYEFPPLMYSSLGASESKGKVRVEFETPDGRVLAGEAQVWFY